MKKTFTKLAGGFMAASMILGTVGVAAPQVFAETIAKDTASSITINVNSKDDKAHTYKAYEIFDGVYDTSANPAVLKQITWGKGINTDAFNDTLVEAVAGALKVDKNEILKNNILDAELVAEKLGGLTAAYAVDGESAKTTETTAGDADKARAFAAAIKSALTTEASKIVTLDAVTKTEDGKTVTTGYTSNEVNTGYWLVTDTTEGATSGDILSLIYSESTTDGKKGITINPKSSVPESDKNLKDINDSKAERDADYSHKTADYDIGDEVPYQLVASLGDGVSNYKDYYMNFVDVISDGLTLNEGSIKVVVDYDGDGTGDATLADKSAETTDDAKKAGYTLKKTTGQTITTNEPDANDPAKKATTSATKYEFEILDLFTAVEKKNVSSSTKVYVYYTATLNSNCKRNYIGNPNDFYLVYNKDATNTGKGTPGETPTVRNIVFTYDYVVSKVDKDGPLTGAGFTLYKEIKTGNDGFEVKTKTVEGKTVSYIEVENTETNTKQEIVVVKGSDITYTDTNIVKKDGTKGIQDDTYYVVKDSVAVGTAGTQFGFNGLDDGKYVLVETTIPNGYNPIAPIDFEVSATHTDSTLTLDTLTTTQPANVIFTDTKTGLESTIENKKGTELPSTGGIGTTIFYIVGAAAAVTAVVLLTTRRRANKED